MVPVIRSETQNFLSLWAIFSPFTTPTITSLMIPKIKILKKKFKKCLGILSFYTYMCTINEDHAIYGSWNIRCNRQKFLTFWASILITWKIKILTLKKTPGDIIILHICTTNDNHMMYSSWDMERYRQNILSFWTVFLPFYLWWTEFFVILHHCCPFTPLTTQKIKTLKKWKNQLEILSFYTCVP